MKYAVKEVQTRFSKGNVSKEIHKKCEGTQWGKDAQMEWPEDMARNEAEKDASSQLMEAFWYQAS